MNDAKRKFDNLLQNKMRKYHNIKTIQIDHSKNKR